MRIDLGIILGVVLACIFFIYYADTLFYRKINKVACYCIIGAFYVAHLFICAFGNLPVNVITLFLMTFLCFICCYHIDLKNALLQSFVIVLLADLSELIIAFIPHLNISPVNTNFINATQSLILTLTSKSLYLIGIMIVSKLFGKYKSLCGTPSTVLILVPILTICSLFLMLQINITSNLLSGICLLLILINVVLLIINKRMINKDLEIAELKAETAKEHFRLEEYLMLKEKYEGMNVFHHDFKEHMITINALIENNIEKAKEYIKAICKEEAKVHYVKYTNNDMLNIVLTKKKEDCSDSGIEFIIDPIQVDMSFLSDIDTVSLFSNLINNAIEACNECEEKKIFLNISAANKNFITMKIENTVDKKPLVIDGKLRTHKKNKDLHGIGMNSIRRTLTRYDASLDWNYNADNKIFSVTIVLQNNKKDTANAK
jgi:hypothetical protein